MIPVYKKSEAEEQTNFLIYFRQWFAPAKRINPRLLFHIPNGGARRSREATRLREQGVTPGVPDLFFAVPRGDKAGLWIEMKTRVGGRVSVDQVEMLDALRSSGYAAEVAHGADDARQILDDYWQLGPARRIE